MLSSYHFLLQITKHSKFRSSPSTCPEDGTQFQLFNVAGNSSNIGQLICWWCHQVCREQKMDGSIANDSMTSNLSFVPEDNWEQPVDVKLHDVYDVVCYEIVYLCEVFPSSFIVYWYQWGWRLVTTVRAKANPSLCGRGRLITPFPLLLFELVQVPSKRCNFVKMSKSKSSNNNHRGLRIRYWSI